MGVSATLRTAFTSAAAVALVTYGCARPESFSGDTDAAVMLPSPGTGGMGLSGGAGGMETGGEAGSGGDASRGGSFGGGGGGRGGVVGVGGAPAGGGQAGGRDPATGGGGGTATGGVALGGMPGSGGAAGMGGGGLPASGGAGGRGGPGGSAGSGGGGGGGAGGSAGSAGVAGTNPCAGLCSRPIVFTTKAYSSGNLGTAETCHETTASITSGNCSNFTSRTFRINNTSMSTAGTNWPTLPAKRNGGYCFQASAGTPDFAAFVTF